MTKSLEAWVLHKQWSGDTSARVRFFTRELGLVNCLCKGGRTPKKQALLQAFTPLWLAVDERHGYFYSRSIESNQPALPLAGDALFSALYVNELLYYVLRPMDTDEDLFAAYLQTVHGLAGTQDNQVIESLLRRFEWTLLQSCGASFSLTEAARTEEPIVSGLRYQLVAGEGFVVANKGIPGEHIVALAEDDLTDAQCLKSAKVIMRQAIDQLLGGREIKARALFAARITSAV